MTGLRVRTSLELTPKENCKKKESQKKGKIGVRKISLSERNLNKSLLNL
jgi:hypothetical protein